MDSKTDLIDGHGFHKALKHTPKGGEYWTGRELMTLLGYSRWENFTAVIGKAIEAFRESGENEHNHFRAITKKVAIGSGAEVDREDYYLSRAACYLVAMNGDSAKPEIAAAQRYFAIQTRRMELADQHSADEKRLELREKVSASMKRVSAVAQQAGVKNTMQGVFHDQRYIGLYNGLSSQDVKKKKGLTDKDNFFDFAGPLELSAHDFQMNLAADVISRENITGQQRVIEKNKSVGTKVRAAIRDSGGTMPENLPLAPEPIKVVQKRVKATVAKRIKNSSGS